VDGKAVGDPLVGRLGAEAHLDRRAVRALLRARLDRDERRPALAEDHLEAHGVDRSGGERAEGEVHRHVRDALALGERDLARLAAGRRAARAPLAMVDEEVHHRAARVRRHARPLPARAEQSAAARDRLELGLEQVAGRALDARRGAQQHAAVLAQPVLHHVRHDGGGARCRASRAGDPAPPAVVPRPR
jgi:hypothetical protein